MGAASSSSLFRYAIVRPSGDHSGDVFRPGAVDTLVREPPTADTVHTSLFLLSSYSLPERSETKTMRVPSGDHCGSVSFQSSPLVICLADPVVASMTQRCDLLSSNQPVSLNL